MKIKMIKYIIFLSSIMIVYFVVLTVFTFNTTGSLPKGIYYNTFKKEPSLNDIVLFCPPLNDVVHFGYEHKFFKSSYICHGKYQPLMKRIVASENDTVKVTDTAVLINNIPIDNTAYINFLPSNMRTYFQGKLRKNEYFLLSNYHKKSFDSRYFGTVNKKNIIKTIKPLFIWR